MAIDNDNSRKNINRDISLYVTKKQLEKHLEINKIQQYIPITDFFNENNPIERNVLTMDNIIVEDSKGKFIKQKNIPLFCKYAPIIDPIKYMIGKYDIGEKLFVLPSNNGENGIPIEKVNRRMNHSYIDSLFCSLSKEDSNFIHGIDYFGTYLGIKSNFSIDIEDDINILSESEFFHDNNDKLFSLNYVLENCNEFTNESNKNKEKLCIEDNVSILDNIVTLPYLDVVEVSNNTMNPFINIDLPQLVENFLPEIDTDNIKLEDDSDNSSEITDIDCEDLIDENNNDEENDDDYETIEGSITSELDYSDNSSDTSSSCQIEATIKEFPVTLILLERCNQTLEDHINTSRINYCNELDSTNELDSSDIIQEDISVDEWKSILFQIIITLVYYQKKYSFTHNDLHSCNIMYIETDDDFIYYNYNSVLYKVPTFGKIYKIIDFGRSIFNYNNITFCSDSFSPGEDAHSQYNCEPFFNDSKPRLEPNMSFDLCRLGCSLFDYFIDEMSNIEDIINNNPIANIIYNWTLDDQGRNVLYRKNGEERYPDFKLYKMISRNVHNHIPKNEIENILFNSFKLEISNEDLLSNIIYI